MTEPAPEKKEVEDDLKAEDDAEIEQKLSDSAEVLEAKAKLTHARVEWIKAKAPLYDKIILRGVIPLVLTIAGPWAGYVFKSEQAKQSETITALQQLLENAKKEAADRQTRMNKLEEEKAAELSAMSAMVIRLGHLLNAALVQQRVSDSIKGGASKAETVRAVTEQMRGLGSVVDPETIEDLAGEQYDSIMEQIQEQRE